MKLKREAHALFVQGTGTSWQIVGEDIDDMSVEMNGSFDSSKNILGEDRVTDTGYAPSIGVDTYYANPDDNIYEFLKDIAMNRKSGDEAKGKYLEVLIEKTTGSNDAWQEDCIFEVTSYGGAAGGSLNIAYTVHPCGNRKKGTATIENKQPTFVEGL
ncbi:MAG: hypothetical protein KBT34_09900 [Prevotella sp.]|nr:hypothetical protein [Candidatus Prevotella equi]